MSTLIEELELAAARASSAATGIYADTPAKWSLRADLELEAVRLKARIEHVKRQESDWRAAVDRSGSEIDIGILKVVLEVIGDLP